MDNFCENGGVPDSLETCGEPPPPPDSCQGKPDDWWELPLTIGEGENAITEIHCVQMFPEDQQQDCKNPIGTIQAEGKEEQIICGDHQAECSNGGGTWGLWNGEAICLPSDYGDPPTCDPDGKLHLVETFNEETLEKSGSYVCESPVKPIEQDEVPGTEEPGDIDGDGVPDHEDDDMDGDGTPNDQDSDADGDGTADSEQDGPVGDDGENSVAGGEGCELRPTCKGDPIQCSINYQIWASRCKADKLTEDQPDENPGELDLSDSGDLVSSLDEAFLDGVNELTGEGNQGIEAGTSALESAMTGILPTVSACQDFVINFAQGNIVISCEKLATFRDIIGWALYILTAWHLFMIATTPIQSRV